MPTRHAAVWGSPISHSLSPTLHRVAYRELDIDWSYEAVDVPLDSFPDVLSLAQTDDSLAGLSITMPLKSAALSAADVASDIARRTQAANTLVFRGGGIEADNTDPEGIVWALSRAGIQGTLPTAGLIGAGATARSSLAAFHDLAVTEVHVMARRPSAIEDLANVAKSFGISLVPHTWDDPSAVLACPVVISTAPKCVADSLVSYVPAMPGVLLDVVYSPWPTVMASSWSESRGLVVSGLEMLVGQAGRQVELMTGKQAPLDAMLIAGMHELRR